MNRLAVAAACLLGPVLVQAGTASYAIDPTHTFAYFELPNFGISTIRGRFDRKSGSVQLDREAGTGRVEITIEAASIDTGVPALDAQLQGKDFLDVVTDPTLRFVGDGFVFDGDQVRQVSGLLTMHGQTHPLTLKATRYDCYTHPILRRQVCGGDFEAVVQRSQWGLGQGVTSGLPDKVSLLIQVEAIRQ